MQVERVESTGNKVVLHAIATGEEFREATRQGVRAFLMSADAPIPEDSQLDTILGQLLGEAGDLNTAKADFAANYLLPRAIRQQDIIPVCSPSVESRKVPGDDGNFELRITVFPKPHIELSSYEPVDITVQAPQVTEDEVDAHMLSLMQKYGEHQVGLDGQGKVAEPQAVSLDDLDDAWVAKHIPDPEVNTVERMRETVRKTGEQYKSAEFEQYKLSVAAHELSKRLVDSVPTDIIVAMAESMINELRAQASAQGSSLAEVCQQRGMDEDAMMQEARDEAQAMLMQGLTLDAIYRHEGLSIDDADRAAALHSIAPGSEDAAEAQLRASGYAFTIEETAQRLRAGRYILEHAHVTVQV